MSLKIGSKLKIWINPYTGTLRRTLVLQGDVVWCKPAKEEGESHYVGIRLNNEPAEAIKAWVSCVNEELRMMM